MKVRVSKTTTTDDGKKPTANTADYSAWGDQAALAKSQGFYPETTQNGVTVFRSNYSPAFNDIVLNPITKQKGHIAVIGNPNQSMDIVIRDNDGNIVHTIAKAQSPNAVQTYLTNVVGTRQNAVLRTTKPIDIATK